MFFVATEFAEVIAVHPTLTVVDMRYNRIAKEKSEEQKNPNPFDENPVDPWEGAKSLIAALDPASGGNKNITKFTVDASIPDELFTKLNKMGGGGKKKKGKKKKVRLWERSHDTMPLHYFWFVRITILTRSKLMPTV